MIFFIDNSWDVYGIVDDKTKLTGNDLLEEARGLRHGKTKRFHTHRALGCYCDYCDFAFRVDSGIAHRQGGHQGNGLQVEPQAMALVLETLFA